MKTAALPADLSARADLVRIKVARNLTELLEADRWSRRAAAERLGLTHTYVTSRASGAVELSSSDLQMFADFLGVPVSRFFEEPTSDGDIPRIGSKRRTEDYQGDVSPIVDLAARRRQRSIDHPTDQLSRA